MDFQDVLLELGIEDLVSISEFEESLNKVEVISESTLFLGLLARIDDEKRADILEKVMVLITDWKNMLPHSDLGGLSPIEYREKFCGGFEENILADMLCEYQNKINRDSVKDKKDFNLENDFKKFQDEYFSRIPSAQPFFDLNKILNFREIIIEERRRLGVPAHKLEELEIKMFTSNCSDSVPDAIEKYDVSYYSLTQELSALQTDPFSVKNRKKTEKIFRAMKEIEPFMRFSKEAPHYYNNLGQLAFVCDEIDVSLEFLRKAIKLDPEYTQAKEALKRLTDFFKQSRQTH